MDKKLILLTGGHLTPALAIIPELQKNGFEVHFAGRVNAMEGDTALSEEYKEITKLKIPFHKISTGRIQRTLTSHSLSSLFKIPLGIIQAEKLITNLKPDCILSFGGYMAVPISISAKIHGIPIVTHEQTVTLGLANRLISKLANLNLVSHEESLKDFPKEKTILVGNPIRKEVFDNIKDLLPKEFADKIGKYPLIYITGGNQGSHAINNAVKKILPEILEKYLIINQTGSGKNSEDFKFLSELKMALPESLKEKYLLYPYISSELIGTVLGNADLIISRSGANTISEITALKKVAILIPLPNSGGGEQLKNAQKLVEKGVAVILNQADLEDKLLTNIEETIKSLSTYKLKYNKISLTYNLKTSLEIVVIIERLLNVQKKDLKRTKGSY